MEYVTVDGEEIPALGFGTWQLRGEHCEEAVSTALDLGYRHIDTAQLYENESAVGDAVAASDVDRSDIFLVTKVRGKNLAYEDVRSTVEESLDKLQTHIDLLLSHSPNATVPIEETLEAMNEFQATGSVEHIGVSNFSVAKMQEAMAASETPIVTNQVEYHPYKDQDEVHGFCVDNDCVLTAYSPLAEQVVLGDETLQEIGERYGKSEAAVALRWLIQQENVAAIPKAASREHQRENMEIYDFELTDEEMSRIDTLSD